MKTKFILTLSLIFVLSIISDTQARVIVYSAPWCGFCVRLEKYLSQQNVQYIKIDTDKNTAAKKEAVRKSGQGGIPVLDWDGEIIVGFANAQKEEIDRLIAGGSPVVGRFVPPETISKNSVPQKPQIDPFSEGLKNIKNLFEAAQVYVSDTNAADILKKLYDAHVARLIYESVFTEQFQKRIADASINIRSDSNTVAAVKNVAAARYIRASTTCRGARLKDSHAAVEAQKALRAAIAPQQSTTGAGSNLNQNQQTFFLKIWSCTAIDPSTGNKIQFEYVAKTDSKQDATLIKINKLLDNMPNTQLPDKTKDPNSLLVSD